MEDIVHWRANLTRELDKYLIFDYHKHFFSYLWGYTSGIEIDEYNRVVIRVPGASRGYVQVDSDLIIQKVVIYADSIDSPWRCYKKEVLKILDAWVGKKLVIEK